MSLYRLHGPNAIPVSKEQAKQIGCDIFIRAADARAWIVALTLDTKQQQLAQIRKSPLVPSFVVETRLGHEVYFVAKTFAPNLVDAVVLERLAPAFNAGGARYARKPNYCDGRHVVTIRWQHPVSYTEQQIASAFPRSRPSNYAAPTIAPVAESTFACNVETELRVLAGLLQGNADILTFIEQDDFMSPLTRMLFTAIRNAPDHSPVSVHQQLERQDALADTTTAWECWPLAAIAALASGVPLSIDYLLDGATQLAFARVARETVLAVDADYERQQQELDELALREVA